MRRINLKKVLTSVSMTLVGPDEYLIADIKIEIQSKDDSKYCYLIFNYPFRILKGSCGSNLGLMMAIYNVRTRALGEVKIYLKGELIELWKTFSRFWEKYRNIEIRH